jgi:hypothetical protein
MEMGTALSTPKGDEKQGPLGEEIRVSPSLDTTGGAFVCALCWLLLSNVRIFDFLHCVERVPAMRELAEHLSVQVCIDRQSEGEIP